ncbi:uncharacterized protein G2W53_026685 [Senna tora]|uniref:Uncharacterized protein n=1 Tax=Senna tora TaxID=362788 RepID=A0A834THW5_9FABA|nr:uncharacterized protein G2W53_026685 [Senna tora]
MPEINSDAPVTILQMTWRLLESTSISQNPSKALHVDEKAKTTYDKEF